MPTSNKYKSLFKANFLNLEELENIREPPYCTGNELTQDIHTGGSEQDTRLQRSMGHELIWPNITIAVNIGFQEILALTRVRHIIASSNRVIVQTKCRN